MLNRQAFELFPACGETAERWGCRLESIGRAQVIDAGIHCTGSLRAGLLLARICLADQAEVTITPADRRLLATNNAVHVQTDHPLRACLGSQYAGWPLQTDDYFAMASGPMRLARGREPVLTKYELSESPDRIAGVLESDRLPTAAALAVITEQCGTPAHGVALAVAPTTSIAGSLQVVARSVETAMHKLDELNFDVRSVVAGTGSAPLPPPARCGDTLAGIGRTNDAMLYGATVTLWVDHDDDAIEEVASAVPSSAADDHGQPFAEIFRRYDHDFYKVDPLLFSPAVVTIHNLKSGRTWTHGQIETRVLEQSFWK